MTVELFYGTVIVETDDFAFIEVTDTTVVDVDNAPNVTVGSTAELLAHIDSPRPHQNAESGYDAAAFFNAITV